QRIGKAHYRRKMVRMGTGISGDNARDFSLLSMQCTRENFDTSWAYFTDIITKPAFDQIEFDNFKQSVLLGINSRTSDAETYSTIEADSIYFAGHPYGRMMDADDVRRESIPILKEHYRAMMVKKRLLL